MTTQPASKDKKQDKFNFFATYSPKKSAQDSGSPESQIAIFTMRIRELTEHLKRHKKDKGSLYGLKKMVGKRQKLLTYLFNNSSERYQNICKTLSIKGIR